MTLNVIDWLRESAAFLAADRPDIFTQESAVEQLSRTMDEMRALPGSGLTSFADYFLIRFEDEDIEEWDLVKKLSSAVNYQNGEVWVHSWTDGGESLKFGVDLPGVDDDVDDDDEDVVE